MDKEVFRERLKIVIKSEKNLSAFAKKSGFSEGLLRSYKSGGSIPNLSTAAAIASAAGVSLDWLAGLDPENASPPAPPAAVDADLMTCISNAISLAYREIGSRSVDAERIRAAVTIYNKVTALSDDPAERTGMIKLEIFQLRQELAKPVTEQDRSKRRG